MVRFKFLGELCVLLRLRSGRRLWLLVLWLYHCDLSKSAAQFVGAAGIYCPRFMCDIVKEIYIDWGPDIGSNFIFTICRVVHNRIELHGQGKMDKNEQLIDAVLKSAKSQHQPDG